MPFDIDYKVMGTFTDFYMALLKFVNFKLFSDLGLPYPMQQEDIPLKEDIYQTDIVPTMQANVRKLIAED